jgi:glutamate synthase domain-containing protein 2
MSCEYYKMCETNQCPTGTTTQDPTLLQRFHVDEGARRLTNFIQTSTREMANIARAVGKDDIHKLDKRDLVALTKGAGELSGVKYPEIL